MWIDADVVAKAAVDGLASGQTVIVPGVFNKIGASVYQHLPRRLLLPILSRSHPALKKG
jgi:short-subunit dehydrogenase